MTPTALRRVAVAIGAFGLSCTPAAQPPQATAPPSATPPAAQALCNGAFSDGTSIDVASPAFLADVPGSQQFCDFHTFAWNQFLYFTNGSPQFLSMAPWYNLLQQDGAPPPGPYPGGSTALQGGKLDKQQAGDADQLLDVAGAAALYDIRVNQAYYDSLVSQNLYSYALYSAACAPSNGACTNLLWLPPNASTTGASVEIKTAWRDFRTAAACPSGAFFCVGRLALVGLHLVQKTATHGEWIWASFEHAANAPDCAPGSDSPIAPLSPLGTPWSFFDPKTAPPSVMTSKTCSVVAPPQCNTDPQTGSGWKAVNICRTDPIPAGGASPANCAVKTAPPGQHLPNDQANNPGNVACLNATLLPQRSGVWQNYKLVGTLWTRGTMKPTQDFRVQVFQTQVQGLPYVEPVGFPHLANTTMETFLQNGSTGYDPIQSNATKAGCFNCHNLPSFATPTFSQLDLSHVVSKFDELQAPRVKAE
jgi:hypothetical protein